MLKKISDHLPQALLLIFFCFSALYSVDMLRKDISLMDFYGQWTICAHTLRGADPYEYVGVNPPLFDDVGSIPEGWGTSPWGCVLGNLFYPGYMSFEPARIYFFAISTIVILLTVMIFIKQMMLAEVSRGFWIKGALILLLTPNFWWSICIGNCGGSLCCLLLIACLIVEEYPILAGAALGVAMIKPQVALLVCFSFLLMKQFRPLIVAALIDLIAWGATALMVGRSPLTLLTEMFSINIGGLHLNYGILTLWSDKLPSTSWTMPLSMLIGIIFVLVLQRRLERINIPIKSLAIVVPAFTAINFWSYSRAVERFSLILLVILGLWLLEHATNIVEKMQLMLIMVLGNFFVPLILIVVQFFEEFLGFPTELAMYYSWTIFDIIYILTVIFLTIRLTCLTATPSRQQ